MLLPETMLYAGVADRWSGARACLLDGRHRRLRTIETFHTHAEP